MKTLIHSPNWLGDVVMALGAFNAWRKQNPDDEVFVYAKPSVALLWRFVPGVTEVITAEPLPRCDRAIILPNSFRSAAIVRKSGTPRRRGTLKDFRFFLINEPVFLRGLRRKHQVFEYARIFGGDAVAEPLIDVTRLPPLAADFLPPSFFLILPGAARGDSKRWPVEYFAAAANIVCKKHPDARFVICGTPDERAVCDELAAKLGDRALNLAGKTKLPELAAVISRAKAVCCNDSGGMHLSTAIGTPVVAIFGITDWRKTGPLGERASIVAAEGVRVSRRIPRESKRASAALRSVTPERVAKELLKWA